MKIQAELHHIYVDDIKIPWRQRTDIKEDEIKELAENIERHGLVHPILMADDGNLIVGERRLLAYRHLSRHDDTFLNIPCRIAEELTPKELQYLELVENTSRKDLSWQDESKAYLKIYEMERAEDDKYTFFNMEGDLAKSERTCRRNVRVGRAVQDEDKEILAAQTMSAANGILDRRMNRAASQEIAVFGKAEAEISLDDIVLEGEGSEDVSKGRQPAPLPFTVEEKNFCDEMAMMDSYSGPQFNFVHCDFPYGIDLDKSDQYKTEHLEGAYLDADETWYNCLSALVLAKDQGVLSASCHVLLWHPNNIRRLAGTEEFFLAHGFRVASQLCVWGKSDKMGIIADAERMPRNISELALILSLGDRRLIKAGSNVVWHPSERKLSPHPSYKPEGMLDEFLRMFVDHESIVLDPTCGSGSALASALRLRAARVVGWDINEDCVSLAYENCENAHNLMLRGA